MRPTATTIAFRTLLRRIREAHERLIEQHGKTNVAKAEKLARGTPQSVTWWLARPRAELRRAYESLPGKSRP